MIKLNILNMKNFLETVNACNDSIYQICPDGRKVDIHRQHNIQVGLLEKFRKQKNRLSLVLEIPNPKDYMNIVSYYAGDC